MNKNGLFLRFIALEKNSQNTENGLKKYQIWVAACVNNILLKIMLFVMSISQI
jgi:hypothetical protein